LPVRWRFQSRRDNLQKKEEQTLAENKSQKTGRKKNGKVAEVFLLYQKGIAVKDIAKTMKLSERVVRSYVWRAGNPEKYRSLLKRYQQKKKERLSSAKPKKKT
jgi:hypothetical protein